MSNSDRAVRVAGTLLVARVVDQDDRAVRELVDRIHDIQEARNVITIVMSMIDGLLE